MHNELVKALRETDFSYGCPCGAEPLCKDKDCVIIQAADAIEELMRRCEQFQYMPLPAWIPVTERLPEKHEWVLVRSKLVKMKTDFISNDGRWYATPGVTHWMPLPEPPKGERKDDADE